MIITEFYETRQDGINLYRTYSDAGFCIERDGEIYDEAIDPEGSGRIYAETDIPSSVEVEDELSAEETLSILTGGDA